MEDVPAVDLQAEKAVLGALLLLGDPRCVAGLTVRGLRSEHFYWQAHQRIFTAAVSICDRHGALDSITVAAELDRLGLADGISRDKIEVLSADTPVAGNFGEYADRVMEMARWRARDVALKQLGDAVRRRDGEAYGRAREALESAVTGTRTESYSPDQWGSLLFAYYSKSKEETDLFVIPTPFAKLNDALGGGWRPGQFIAGGGATSHGKALAVSTPILTPDGWTTMGELQAGDRVFGANGDPTVIVQTHPVRVGSRCYDVEFSDGSVITADADHLWRYEIQSRQRVGPRIEGRSRSFHTEMVATTEALAVDVSTRTRPSRVRLACPIVYPQADLLVAPYLLGLWLGDGSHHGARITTHSDDAQEMVRYIHEDGEQCNVRSGGGNCSVITVGRPDPSRCRRGHMHVGRWTRCRECHAAVARGESPDTLWPAWNVSPQARLRTLGVLYPEPKRIPAIYLRADVDQRLKLLQGLVDSDGSIDRSGGVEIVSTLPALVQDITDLVQSLGASVRVYEKSLIPGKRGTSRAWRIIFRMELIAARLSRKRERLQPIGDRKRYRYVSEVREVESVPVRCITVAAEDGMFLAGRSLIPTHNSAFFDQCADSAAKHGKRVHIYMTEMTALDRGMRYIARRTGIPFLRQLRNEMSNAERDLILAELGRMEYGCTVAVDWHIDDVVRDALRGRYDLVIVDLVHGFHYEDERGLDKLSKAMQRLARVSTTIDGHPGTAVIGVTHLKEEGLVKGKVPRPTITSIKGGSSLKQDADCLCFVWQDQDEGGIPTGDGEIWFAKGRSSGIDKVEVRLNPSRFRFELRESAPTSSASSTGAPF